MSSAPPLLQVDDLHTHLQAPSGVIEAVAGVSFTLRAGRTLGIVGESGAGKSLLARSVMGLLPGGIARMPRGRILFDGRDLRTLPEPQLQRLRGRGLAMVFQDPLSSLNPVMTIGRQIGQVLRQHTALTERQAQARAVELLAEVGIADPARRVHEYAHRLSGGMCQRAVIAIALAGAPRLLIADEPTAALDTTIQAQILELLRRLQERHGMALLLITHSFGVVAQACDEVAVMRAGRIVEQGPVAEALQRPRAAYTASLLRSVPRLDEPSPARRPASPPDPAAGPLSSARHLVKTFRTQGGPRLEALSDLSFELRRGETLAVVGESGSGKTTLAHALMALPAPDSGTLHFDGASVYDATAAQMQALRPRLQMIFQSPLASLNPAHRVLDIVQMPLRVAGRGSASERRQVAVETLRRVGLDAAVIGARRPHELSGGQCQRVSIARALVLRPELLVCDEPVSALDVTMQAQVLGVLEDARQAYALTMLFISHDLAVVRQIADRVMVLYLGRTCEIAPTGALYTAPRHPYTAALLAAVPTLAPNRRSVRAETVRGETPSALDMPSGCRFRTRCSHASARCAQVVPALAALPGDAGHLVACHHPLAVCSG